MLSWSESSSVKDLSHVTRYHLPFDSIFVYIYVIFFFARYHWEKGEKKILLEKRGSVGYIALRRINVRVTDFDIIFHRTSTSWPLLLLTPAALSLWRGNALVRNVDQWPFRNRAGRRSFREGIHTERLVKRHNVPAFKGASTGMRRRADDVTRIDEARCASHANAGNLKRQLEQRCAVKRWRETPIGISWRFNSVLYQSATRSCRFVPDEGHYLANVHIVPHSHLSDAISHMTNAILF